MLREAQFTGQALKMTLEEHLQGKLSLLNSLTLSSSNTTTYSESTSINRVSFPYTKQMLHPIEQCIVNQKWVKD